MKILKNKKTVILTFPFGFCALFMQSVLLVVGSTGFRLVVPFIIKFIGGIYYTSSIYTRNVSCTVIDPFAGGKQIRLETFVKLGQLSYNDHLLANSHNDGTIQL